MNSNEFKRIQMNSNWRLAGAFPLGAEVDSGGGTWGPSMQIRSAVAKKGEDADAPEEFKVE